MKNSVKCTDCGQELDLAGEIAEAESPCPQCGSTKRSYFVTAVNAEPSNYLLDNYIAHKLSELTVCDAPKLEDDTNWLNNFILSTVFRVQLEPEMRAYAFNFLRRTEGASAAYRDAIANVHEYLNTPRNVISPYFRALTCIEICIAQCYQGLELLARASGKHLYTKADGSPEERLQMLYVDSKHMDRMIDGGHLPKEATTGIWITSTGVASKRAILTFVELHDILCEMHGLADWVSKISPSSTTRTDDG